MARDRSRRRNYESDQEVPLTGVRAEFRAALREEIEAAKRAATSSAIPLVEGRRIGQLAAAFQYAFSATSALNVPSDSPGELQIEGRKPVEAIVMSVEGLAVTLSVAEDLGDRVPLARLRSDLVFLLKRLIGRIEDTRDQPNPAGDRLLGEVPASGVPEVIDDPLLNDTQDAALGSGLGRDITFIWGPPGTGKTQTIGSLGEQLYRRGRSVLLVSHMNTAVDQAVLKIADQLGGDLDSGKVLRLGVPSVQRLREREDLLLDAAVRERRQDLHDRQSELRDDKRGKQERISECQRLVAIARWAGDGGTQLADFRARLDGVQGEEEAYRRLVEDVAQRAEREPQLEALLSEANAAARSSSDLERLRDELPRLDEELQATRDSVAAADIAIVDARRDHEKAIELSPLLDRERTLPALAEQRRAVEALAVREAEATQEARSAAAMLHEAEEIHAAASQANAIQRRFRRLPKPEVQDDVVSERRGNQAAAQARLDGISERLRGTGAVLAELEELDGQLAPWRHLSSPEQHEALVRRRENERAAATGWVEELEKRRVEGERELAAATEAVEVFGSTHSEEPTGVIARVEPQLGELRRLRKALEATERRAGELREGLNHDLRTRLTELDALHLIREGGWDSPEERLKKIGRAHAEARRLAPGIEVAERETEIAAGWQQIGAIDEEMTKIDEELEEIRRTVIADATVIATTLTRAYLWNEIQERRFDTVILDEASMAPIPALWIAARLADANVVVVGDFRQLPPIKHAEHALAEKWLGEDIFDVSGVRAAWDRGSPPPHFVQLNEQYRMHPDISAIPNELVYNQTLHDHSAAGQDRGLDSWYSRDWEHDTAVLLVDTGSTNAWVSSVAAGGRASRLNFLSAVVCVGLADRVLSKDAPALPLGAPPHILIATPYRAQAQLLKLLIRDAGLNRLVEAGTVHTFQGSEASALILDLAVDEPHWRVALFTPDYDESNRRLINVALTRAQDRLLVVGDFDYIRKTGRRAFLGGRLLPFIEERYPKVDANDVVPIGLGARAARAQTLIAGDTIEAAHEREVMTQADVYPRLFADFARARERIIIYSPFMTANRLAEVVPHLRAAVEREVGVYIFTKAPEDRGTREVVDYGAMEGQLAGVGATVIHKPGMHEKLVFVDEEVAWTGSLNVLSFRNTQEWMGRWQSPEVVKDFSRPLALDEILELYKSEEAHCPICGSELVPAEGRMGLYWRCIVKGCYTQNMDRPVPRDGVLRCASQGCDGEVEFYDGGNRPVWRCTSNKRHRQQYHPNHLRLPKMRELIAAAVGSRGLAKLKREAGANERASQNGADLATDHRDGSAGGQGNLFDGRDGGVKVTAVDLARQLGVQAKQVRQWLREQARAGNPLLQTHREGEPWEFTKETAQQLAAGFRARR